MLSLIELTERACFLDQNTVDENLLIWLSAPCPLSGWVCVTIAGSRSFVSRHRAVTISHQPDIGHHSGCGWRTFRTWSLFSSLSRHWWECSKTSLRLKNVDNGCHWPSLRSPPLQVRSTQIYTRMWVPWSWPAGYRDKTLAPEKLPRGQCRPIGADYGRGLANERRGSRAECFWPYRVGDFVLCTNWSPRRKGKFYMRRHVRLSRGSLSWSDARVVRLLPCPVLHCCIFRKKSGKFWPVINIKTLAIHGNFIPRVQIKCQTRKSAKCQLLFCSKKFH